MVETNKAISTSTLRQMFSNQDEFVLKSDWHVLQIAPTDSLGNNHILRWWGLEIYMLLKKEKNFLLKSNKINFDKISFPYDTPCYDIDN